MAPSLLAVGLDPALIADAASSREAFPDVDAEKVRAGIAASHAALAELGVEVGTCLVDYGATAEDVFRAALAERAWDFVMIGAGVRMDPALTHLLEVLVNTARQGAPGATILFNTSPFTTPDAVRRWFPTPTPLVDGR